MIYDNSFYYLFVRAFNCVFFQLIVCMRCSKQFVSLSIDVKEPRAIFHLIDFHFSTGGAIQLVIVVRYDFY